MDLMDLRANFHQDAPMAQDDSESKKAPGTLKLLELEKKITGPNRQEEYAKYDALLSALQRRTMDALKGELTVEEADKAEKLRQGVIAARKILKFAFVSNS